MKWSLKFKDGSKRLLPIGLVGLFIFALSVSDAITGQATQHSKDLRYRTFFGNCPARTAGTVTMELVSIFEQSRSLRTLKEHIGQMRLTEQYFISDYDIEFDPYRNQLFFRYECPKPLMKVQIYKDSGLDSYEAILVEGGQLYDPTYEVLLRVEGKLEGEIPYLAIPVGEFDENLQNEISQIMTQMDSSFRSTLAEVIVNEQRELTMILSVAGRASSVFLGESLWEQKIEKLQRIVSFMGSEDKVPAIINLTNLKKVVVKFDDRP